MILLAGDFRQTLPVIRRSTPMDELNACLTFARTKSVGVASIYYNNLNKFHKLCDKTC
jgi:PIF1 helicase.